MGMGGTFWASDLKLAFKQAILRGKILFSGLDIPFKSERARNQEVLALQEMDEIMEWFEKMLSSENSEQFFKKTGQTPERIHQRLSILLGSTQNAKEKHAIKRAAVKDLQYLRYHYKLNLNNARK